MVQMFKKYAPSAVIISAILVSALRFFLDVMIQISPEDAAINAYKWIEIARLLPIYEFCFLLILIALGRILWVKNISKSLRLRCFMVSVPIAVSIFLFFNICSKTPNAIRSLLRTLSSTGVKNRPNVELEFVHPKNTALLLVNSSKVSALKPRYGIVLFDIDEIRRNPELKNLNPLPIPAQSTDWIRPGESLGPYQIMELQAVRNNIKSGDRLFGCAYVSCPSCKQTNKYWVYTKDGVGGWYALTKQCSMIGLDMFALGGDTQRYLSMLAPISTRIKISDIVTIASRFLKTRSAYLFVKPDTSKGIERQGDNFEVYANILNSRIAPAVHIHQILSAVVNGQTVYYSSNTIDSGVFENDNFEWKSSLPIPVFDRLISASSSPGNYLEWALTYISSGDSASITRCYYMRYLPRKGNGNIKMIYVGKSDRCNNP